MKVYKNLNQIITLRSAFEKDGRYLTAEDLSIVPDGAIVFDQNTIIWIGPSSQLPEKYHSSAVCLKGHILTPEVVDSHTHLVFGGDRAQEYGQRLNGVSYEEIAKAGGGILYTMTETNKLNPDELFNLAVERVKQISSYGVRTIEIKSGYGLSYEKEKLLTLCIDRLKKHFSPDVQIINTFLAAHDIPKSFKDSRHYLSEVVLPLLVELGPLGIIDFVDIFHEKNYFTSEDVVNLFNSAKKYKIGLKIHADELNTNGGLDLAIDYEAHSADHLLKTSEAEIKRLAKSKIVATLLPGTAFFLGKPLANARGMLNQGAKVAIASDFNPGSCHCDNVLMVSSISAAQLKLNLGELWSAITLNAAHALGLTQQGALIEKLKPRFSLFKVETISHITYNWGKNFSVNLP